jgi:hypothetical protein
MITVLRKNLTQPTAPDREARFGGADDG